jgi:hypothetical protein
VFWWLRKRNINRFIVNYQNCIQTLDKIVKDRKSRHSNVINKNGRDIVAELKLEQGLKDNGFDRFKHSDDSNKEDLKRGNPFVINQSIIDFLANKW